MSADDYRAEAKRLRDTAERPWTPPDAREMLLDVAKAYDALAKMTEKLNRQPVPF